MTETFDTKELAKLLADEFATWHRNLAGQGVIPRAFTGVTAEGNQAVVILSGLPLDRIQRREFLIWLCRKEAFVGYAYSTEVGVVNESGETDEALEIYASSTHADVEKTLLISRQDGGFRFLDENNTVRTPKSDNGPFYGLQRSSTAITDSNEKIFDSLWEKLKPRSMWRKRS